MAAPAILASTPPVPGQRAPQGRDVEDGARFRAVLDASPDSFALWDAVRAPDGTVEDFVLAYANPAIEQRVGRPVGPLHGRRMSEIFPTALSSGRFARYVQTLATGVVTDTVVEYEVDGRWLRLTVTRAGDGVAVATSDVTARVLAEQVLQRSREELERQIEERTRELRESEERFRSLTENSLDVITIVAADGTILYGSQAYERVFGYRLADITGTNVFELLRPEDRAATMAEFHRLLEHPEETRAAEFRLVRPDGTEVWVQAFGQNRLGDPAVRGVVVNSRDITAQRLAAEAVRRAEAMFRGLAQQSLTGCYIGQDGRVIYGNREFAKLFGYETDEILALPSSLDLIAPEERERVAEMLRRRVGGGGDVQYTTLALRKDGTRVPVEVYGSSIELDGRPAVVATVLDISARLRAAEALRASEERFDLAVAGTSDGIWDWNPSSGGFYASPTWKAQLGYADDEIGTDSSEWSSRLHADDAERAHAEVARCLRGERDRLEFECRLRHKDGSYRWILSRGAVVRDASGAVVRLSGAHTDRTLRRELEERNAQQARELEARNAQLARQSEELRRSNEELERFAYAASHDLQEPLRMVTSFTALLAKRYGDRLDPQGREYIEFAVDGATRMQRLIRDLLDYSRVGSRGADFRPLDTSTVLAEVRSNLRIAIDESRALVTHDALPAVLGDATQIGQVFQNLLGNALKFRGDEPPRVHIAVADAADMWRFSIRDNGIGIEPRHAGRIFVMFQRLHSRAEYPGTGIGLALCRRIIERHGGRIWVESAVGQGATFHFTLPKTARGGAPA